MSRRTFVHIGLPKTGTTYLQTMMWRNRARLEDQGFLYPGDKRMDHYHASQLVRGAKPETLGAKADSWDRLRRDLRRWEGDGLVSHEFFCLASESQAGRMLGELQPTEVHVVVTVRDLVRQFPAIWQEALKMNYDGTLDEFVTESLAGRRKGAWGFASQDVPAILDRWSTSVPPDRVHVITTPPPGGPRHLLWERWCQVLGIDGSSFEPDTGRPNESLGAAQAALLHQVKPHLTGELNDGPVRHRWVRGYFGHEVLVPQRGQRFGLRSHQEQQLQERSREAAAYLQGSGFDIVGEVGELISTDTTASLPHPDEISVEDQLQVAARAIDQMIHDVRRLSLENDRLERRLRRHRDGGRLAGAGRWSRLRGAARLRRLGRGGAPRRDQ